MRSVIYGETVLPEILKNLKVGLCVQEIMRQTNSLQYSFRARCASSNRVPSRIFGIANERIMPEQCMYVCVSCFGMFVVDRPWVK